MCMLWLVTAPAKIENERSLFAISIESKVAFIHLTYVKIICVGFEIIFIQEEMDKYWSDALSLPREQNKMAARMIWWGTFVLDGLDIESQC